MIVLALFGASEDGAYTGKDNCDSLPGPVQMTFSYAPGALMRRDSLMRR
jgi:hypothetical protein